MVEQGTFNPKVLGSSPRGRTFKEIGMTDQQEAPQINLDEVSPEVAQALISIAIDSFNTGEQLLRNLLPWVIIWNEIKDATELPDGWVRDTEPSRWTTVAGVYRRGSNFVFTYVDTNPYALADRDDDRPLPVRQVTIPANWISDYSKFKQDILTQIEVLKERGRERLARQQAHLEEGKRIRLREYMLDDLEITKQIYEEITSS